MSSIGNIQWSQGSPSMILKIFKDLKECGYSKEQIIALSEGLRELANTDVVKPYPRSSVATFSPPLEGVDFSIPILPMAEV